MQAVILAGGLGTRLSEETSTIPKPMVEIGGIPLLLHIMNGFAAHGINEFIICVGYKGSVIKEYFAGLRIRESDFSVDLRTGDFKFLSSFSRGWKVSVIDTGQDVMTGGRLKRIEHLLDGESFLMTYGDAVSNIDISTLVRHHRRIGKSATVTAVKPPARFGAITLSDDMKSVVSFSEKPEGLRDFINGGFFVLERGVLELIESDQTRWEDKPLEALARSGQLSAFVHSGFWKPCDTLKDKRELEHLWQSMERPWIRG